MVEALATVAEPRGTAALSNSESSKESEHGPEAASRTASRTASRSAWADPNPAASPILTLQVPKSDDAVQALIRSPADTDGAQTAVEIAAVGDSGTSLAITPERPPERSAKKHGSWMSNSSLTWTPTATAVSVMGEDRSLVRKQSEKVEKRNKEYKIATKKLLEGVLDDAQMGAVRTSSLCIRAGSLRARALKLVRDNQFTYAVSLLVVVNAAFIGVETQMKRCEDTVELDVFYGVQVIFSAIFLLELALRFFAERFDFFRDAWNDFDTILVITSVADTFILQHLFTSGNTLDLIVALRILRLARLMRIFRLLRFFKELWYLLKGILDAAKTLAWAWLLILIIVYIAAIFATRIFGKSHPDDPILIKYFGTLPRSMYTLFTVMTCEGWADVARNTMKVEWWSWIFFIVFIFSTTFAIMHVVVAVIVQHTLEHASHCDEEEREAKRKREGTVIAKIVEVFESADADFDCELSRSEFFEALEKDDVIRLFVEIGLDVRQAENLFDILDYDDSGCLDLGEFVEGVLRARGDIRAMDVLAVQCDMWRAEQKVLKGIEDFTSQLRQGLGPSGICGIIENMRQELSGNVGGKPERDDARSAPARNDPRLLKARITIVSARGLRDADVITVSDPYCVCAVPGKPGLEFQTATIKDDLNPVWAHTREIDGLSMDDSLQFRVLDEDVGWLKADDLLGTATLTASQFYPSSFEGELQLLCSSAPALGRSASTASSSSTASRSETSSWLRVRVCALPSAAGEAANILPWSMQDAGSLIETEEA